MKAFFFFFLSVLLAQKLKLSQSLVKQNGDRVVHCLHSWFIHLWLMIFDFVLFSALEQTYCARMWLYMSELLFVACFCLFCFIHQSGVLTVLAWPVPQETAAISACSVYTVWPCTMLLHAKPQVRKVHACLANRPPALLAEWLGSFTCYCAKVLDSGCGLAVKLVEIQLFCWFWALSNSTALLKLTWCGLVTKSWFCLCDVT